MRLYRFIAILAVPIVMLGLMCAAPHSHAMSELYTHHSCDIESQGASCPLYADDHPSFWQHGIFTTITKNPTVVLSLLISMLIVGVVSLLLLDHLRNKAHLKNILETFLQFAPLDYQHYQFSRGILNTKLY